MTGDETSVALGLPIDADTATTVGPNSDRRVTHHPLALLGRELHPFAKSWNDGYWGLPEAVAWVTTRDLGIVAGVMAYLAHERSSYEDQAQKALKKLGFFPHHQPLDLNGIPPQEALRLALFNRELTVGADRDGAPYKSPCPIPAHTWLDGEFRCSFKGSWWAPNPEMRPEWTNLRFNRFRLMQMFPPALYDLKAPRMSGPWVDALEALTWEAYGHAFSLADFREEIQTGKGLSLRHHWLCVEREWKVRAVQFEPVQCPLRARPIFDGKEGPDQTLQFSVTAFETDLVWLLDRDGLPTDLTIKPSKSALSNGWPLEVTELRSVRFLREKVRPPPERKEFALTETAARRKPMTAAERTKAHNRLHHILRSEPPRSRPKAEIQAELGLTDGPFRKLWEEVALHYPKWRAKGAPKKS